MTLAPAAHAAAPTRTHDVAAGAALRQALTARLHQPDEERVCGALWEIAGTDAWELLDLIVPLLQHARPQIRRYALIAVKSLHPLSGLPAAPGVGKIEHALSAEQAELAMAGWLLPKRPFERALLDVLRSPRCNETQLASSLARLPGEHDSIRSCLQQASPETLASYERQWANVSRVPQQLIIALTYRCNRSCPYCYAYESQDEIRGDIDLKVAEETLDWAKLQGIDLVSFTGGEPTCHPLFAELVRAVARRGMRLYLNSNGLFGKSALEALTGEGIVDVGIHVSEPELHRPNELKLIERNIDALRARGTDVFVRHTLWKTSDRSLPWLMQLCQRHGIHHLNLALGFPGRSASNGFLPSERFREVKPTLLSALTLATTHGVRVRTSKPVPLCLLTHQEFAHFQRYHLLTSTCTVHRRGGVHNLVVNPDRSTYPCVGLPFRGPKLTDASDYAPQATHCQEHIRRALKVVQSACHACAIFPTGACQATCLGHCNEAPQVGKGSEAPT